MNNLTFPEKLERFACCRQYGLEMLRTAEALPDQYAVGIIAGQHEVATAVRQVIDAAGWTERDTLDALAEIQAVYRGGGSVQEFFRAVFARDLGFVEIVAIVLGLHFTESFKFADYQAHRAGRRRKKPGTSWREIPG